MSGSTPTSSPRRARWAAFAALMLGAMVAALLGTAATERWAHESPGFCVSCHADVRTHAGGHRDTKCQSCHATTSAERLSLASALWRSARPAAHHAGARSATCAGCHAQDASFRASPGHAAHAANTPQGACVNCHAGSLHGNASPRERCTSCHAQVPMRSEPRAEGACVRCHEFSRRAPDVAAVLRTGVNGGEARVDATRLHGSVDCRQCHNPHRAEGDPNTPSGADCARCHRGHIGDEVAAGPAGHQTCAGCHSVHAARDNRAVQCDRCHTAPQRQPPTHARQHGEGERVENASAIRAWVTMTGAQPPSAAPPSPSAAPSPSPAPSPSGHPTASAPVIPASAPHNPTWTHGGRCASCHRPHTWTARATDCRGCHAAQSTTLTPETPHGRNDCTSCHDPHGPLPSATVCANCHTAEGQLQRSAPTGHAACTGCHTPHAPGRPTVAVCASCHREQHDHVARGPAQHTNCESCHAPHGAPAARTPATCANCHRVEANFFATTPTPAAHQRCESCHAQHDFSRPAARASCARCHGELASHRGSHRGDCTSCHTPHAPVQGPILTACANCHTTVHIGGPPAANAAHQRCDGCHQPHRPAQAAATACARCHTTQTAASHTWPATSPHGGDCRQCHAPHLNRERPTCGSCHQAQDTPNHRGVHTACVQCHAPHRERPSGGGSAWWSRCAECHRAEGEAARAPTTSATHQQCANCHQRPGLRAPTCATCHTTIPTTLLHASQHHNNCVGCHGTHGNAPPTRTQCVTCHTDRAAHFPDAPRCQSCHPFSPSGGHPP